MSSDMAFISAGGGTGAALVADTADARGDGKRVRRDADFPVGTGEHGRCQETQGAARPEGRGHAQYGGTADRVLRVRAKSSHGAAVGRADGGKARRAVARGTGR